MKVCLISNLYEPHVRGGAEKIVQQQAEGLNENGHDVVVISTKPQFGLDRIEKKNNFVIYRFLPWNIFYYLNDYKYNPLIRSIWHIIDTFNLQSAIQVLLILIKEKPDLVVTHNLKGIGLMIPLVIKGLRKKHYHVLHDVQLAIPSGLIIKNQENSFLNIGFPTKIYRFFTKLFFGSPQKTIFPSVWLQTLYQSYGFFRKSNQQILRNPLPKAKEFVSIKTKKYKTYGYLGQLEEHKGIDWLLDTWEKKKIQSKLLVAGKGSLNLDKYKASKKMDFLGLLKKEEIEDFFQRIDFLIVPSLCYENSPTVILEAFKYATPVIVSDIGGAAELVTESETGFIFEPLNDDDLLEKVITSINLTDKEYSNFSSQSLDKSHQFDSDKYIQSLLLSENS